MSCFFLNFRDLSSCFSFFPMLGVPRESKVRPCGRSPRILQATSFSCFFLRNPRGPPHFRDDQGPFSRCKRVISFLSVRFFPTHDFFPLITSPSVFRKEPPRHGLPLFLLKAELFFFFERISGRFVGAPCAPSNPPCYLWSRRQRRERRFFSLPFPSFRTFFSPSVPFSPKVFFDTAL